MYFVYDLKLDGFVVYTGLTADPGRSLTRHLALGRRFDSLHLVERLPRLEDARAAAQRRRDRLVLRLGVPGAPGRSSPRTLSGYGPAPAAAGTAQRSAPPGPPAPAARGAPGAYAARR